jgi:hypothetical protein
VELPPPNGSTGSTATASTNTVVTSHQLSWRPPTTLNNRDQPPAELSDQKVSGLTGVVHRGFRRFIRATVAEEERYAP